MGQITWNTDCNAPCCPGEIVNHDGRTLLIQTDWDYPGTAQSFGWSLRTVQRCRSCGHVNVLSLDDVDELSRIGHRFTCDKCDRERRNRICDHDATDGTVPCGECLLTQSDFISAAYDWLRANDGATADDPGYFLED